MTPVLTLAHAKSQLTRAKSRLTRSMNRLTCANEYIKTSTPLAPPGTKVIVHEKPTVRGGLCAHNRHIVNAKLCAQGFAQISNMDR